MKYIGIIGGLGVPSTIKYYQWINESIHARLGGGNAAKILLTSLNGAEIKDFRVNRDKEGEEKLFQREAMRLEKAGADFIVIASNTSHRNAAAIQKKISIPLLHLATETAKAITQQGGKRVLLLGTLPTMTEDFYKHHLKQAGIEVVVPSPSIQRKVSDLIYNELVKNKVTEDTREFFAQTINDAFNDKSGAKKNKVIDGVILGCTELTLLDLAEKVEGIPLYDTTKIHVQAIVDFALK